MILHALLLSALALISGKPITAPAPEANDDLTELGLEDLLDIEMEVTRAGRKGPNIMDTAAAIFVSDNEDIRRSGMSQLPDLLRTVPGLEVANLNSKTWAIGARDFTRGPKMRFEVNTTEIKRRGLSISSKLLKFARIVKEAE